jgi:hypothetical protein
MEFQVLTDDAPGRAAWHALLERLPSHERDIHFLPEYGAVYRETYGYQPLLAVLTDGPRFVVQPFVKRPLNDLPFLHAQGVSERYYDLASPYGYGGPAFRCDGPADKDALMRAFTERFLEYCRSERLASEFTSLHPLLGGGGVLERSGIVGVEARKEVVYMDLAAPEAERWKGVRKGHRSSIAKARKSGVRVDRVAPTRENFDELNRLYYMTMERNNADQRWLFPTEYFRNCYERLGEDRVSLFFAMVGPVIATASILIHDADTAYYHFSGSDEQLNPYCAGNLLVYEAADWARSRGYRRFHLGGGVSSSPQDRLFVFKSGFSDHRATLRTYHRVLDQVTYDYLCVMKTKHEDTTGGEIAAPDFFPFYRR